MSELTFMKFEQEQKSLRKRIEQDAVKLHRQRTATQQVLESKDFLTPSQRRNQDMLRLDEATLRRVVRVECLDVFQMCTQAGVQVPSNNLHLPA